MNTRNKNLLRLYDQDFHKLRAQCLQDRRLFEDPTFPADQRGFYKKYDHMRPREKFEWLRPGEISSKPVLFSDGVSRFDTQQGEIGDCWFIGSVSSFASIKTHSEKDFHRVIPEDQGFGKDYAGIFYFRFWQFGDWVEVVVDDRLPTRYGTQVSLTSSDGNEYWSALLEKAYAKLQGSYEALDGGFGSEALVDLTGSFSIMYPIESGVDIFKTILKAYEQKALIGCSTKSKNEDENEDDDEEEANSNDKEENKEEEKTNDVENDIKETEEDNEEDTEAREEADDEVDDGLVDTHYYSVTCVKYVPYVFLGEEGVAKMLRLRNPWGSKEWKGAGADDSLEWNYIPQKVKDSMKLKVENDGEFWIPYQSFIEKFDLVEICHLPSVVKKTNKIITVHGKWDKGPADDVDLSKNPQHVIETTLNTKPTKVHIYLMEKHGRKNGRDDQNLSIYICRYDPKKALTEKPVKDGFVKMKVENKDVVAKDCKVGREVYIEFEVKPSERYVIVPARQYTDKRSEYLLRVVYDCPLSLHTVQA